MLRKKLGKEGPKPAPSTTIKPVVQPKPVSSQPVPKTVADPRDKLNKDRIAELVANKIRQTKKENTIIQNIQSQVGAGQKKRFQEYQGRLSGALKLTHNHFDMVDAKIPLKQKLGEYLASNFKLTSYI